jgi:hypothetical protein
MAIESLHEAILTMVGSYHGNYHPLGCIGKPYIRPLPFLSIAP